MFFQLTFKFLSLSLFSLKEFYWATVILRNRQVAVCNRIDVDAWATISSGAFIATRSGTRTYMDELPLH